MANFNWPVNSSTVTATNPSVSDVGLAIPSQATMVGFEDPSGNLQPGHVNASGAILVDITGGVTPADTNIAQWGGTNTTLGQKAMAAGVPVTLASDQSAIPVSQSGTWTVQPGNTANTTPWLTTINQGGNSATVTVGGALLVDGTGGTQPVSGTVTVLQGTTPWTDNITQVGGSAISLGQKTMANSFPVTISSDQTAFPVTANAGTNLNTSALALETTLQTVNTSVTGLQVAQGSTTAGQLGPLTQGAVTTANPTYTTGQTAPLSLTTTGALRVDTGSAATGAVNIVQVGGSTITLSQKAASGSFPVVLASDQSSIPTSPGGLSAVNRVRNDYTSTPVTTSAYVQLLASTSAAVKQLFIFDSSGQTLVLATGGSGSEVDQMYIVPGGNGIVPLAIASSTRVAIKAVSANATLGEIDINFYG